MTDKAPEKQRRKKYEICGGCGADHPDQRCIGCFHPFEEITE